MAPSFLLGRLALSPQELGWLGECVAARWLTGQGFRLLVRRLETGSGEVDLLLRDNRSLVCVEVKTGRAGPRFRPGLRVDRSRLDRLRNAAAAVKRDSGEPTRVDLVEVCLTREGKLMAVLHLRDLDRIRSVDAHLPDLPC